MSAVRPTERCLADLGIPLPMLDVALQDIAHPLIEKAQSLPEEASSGGGERIRSLSDRVWLKVKTSNHRGASTQLSGDDLTDLAEQMRGEDCSWWLGAGGQRQEDSASDFYRQLESECRRAGRGSGGVSSVQLLPTERDVKRLSAEQNYRIDARLRELVCSVIARSIQDGQLHGVQLQREDVVTHELEAVVQTRDGVAYLSIGARGFVDYRIIGVALNAVPGVGAGDWMAEPGPVLGISPQPGQIIYSTIIPPSAQAEVLRVYRLMTSGHDEQ